MKLKAKGMVMASFVADSLALGAHWVYNTHVIERKFGRVEHLEKPLGKSYHGIKNEGDFTHYGDQTLVLLESIAECSGFDLARFSHSWKSLFKSYDGYFDKATKETLENFAAGSGPDSSGSDSTDLAGAARIAPIVYTYTEDLDTMITASRSQTLMSHRNPLVVESAEFFARVIWDVLRGSTPTEALERVRREDLKEDTLAKWVDEGLKSTGVDTVSAIDSFGQACEIDMALPSTIHLIAKYENDLNASLIENVMAGGDSASRGMLAGMILGAHLGYDAISATWIGELNKADKIIRLLDMIDDR
ncbi:MAG: ADP-ribosylglycohydrolase family protein [Thermodesulfobacteriota bacterium]|nr:ADP-ribosylglycohydrolase family protein [Thermodesulfobacteriota bacterium]